MKNVVSSLNNYLKNNKPMKKTDNGINNISNGAIIVTPVVKIPCDKKEKLKKSLI